MIGALTELKPLTRTFAVTGGADIVVDFRRQLLPTDVVHTPVFDGLCLSKSRMRTQHSASKPATTM